jgi:hypothetical protein
VSKINQFKYALFPALIPNCWFFSYWLSCIFVITVFLVVKLMGLSVSVHHLADGITSPYMSFKPKDFVCEELSLKITNLKIRIYIRFLYEFVALTWNHTTFQMLQP